MLKDFSPLFLAQHLQPFRNMLSIVFQRPVNGLNADLHRLLPLAMIHKSSSGLQSLQFLPELI
jgi:hypothetical protein